MEKKTAITISQNIFCSMSNFWLYLWALINGIMDWQLSCTTNLCSAWSAFKSRIMTERKRAISQNQWADNRQQTADKKQTDTKRPQQSWNGFQILLHLLVSSPTWLESNLFLQLVPASVIPRGSSSSLTHWDTETHTAAGDACVRGNTVRRGLWKTSKVCTNLRCT